MGQVSVFYHNNWQTVINLADFKPLLSFYPQIKHLSLFTMKHNEKPLYKAFSGISTAIRCSRLRHWKLSATVKQ